MARLYILLLLMALTGLAPAADQSERNTQVSGIHKWWKPKAVNGCPTTLSLGDFLKIPDADYQLNLNVDIVTGSEMPAINAAEVEVRVFDEKGKPIPMKANLPGFFRVKGYQMQSYRLQLKRGQKVGSIRVRWKGSEQSYSMAESKEQEETITL